MDLKFRYKQVTPDGPWESSEVFAGDFRKATQGVIAGYITNQPRAAVEEGTGRVIYALDARGQATAEAVRMFDTVVKAKTAAPKTGLRAGP